MILIKTSAHLRSILIASAPFTALMDRAVIRVYSSDMPEHPENAAGEEPMAFITTDGGLYDPDANGLLFASDGLGGAINTAAWKMTCVRTGAPKWLRLSTRFAVGNDNLESAFSDRVDLSAGVIGIGTAILPAGSVTPVARLQLSLLEHV